MNPEEFHLSTLDLFPTERKEGGTYHISLEASAGTGKTTAITGIVLLALLRDVPLRHIVAITYTKVGAGEMQNKVRQSLKIMLQALNCAITSEEKKEDAEDAIATIEKLNTTQQWKKDFPYLLQILTLCKKKGFAAAFEIFLQAHNQLSSSTFSTLHSFSEKICKNYPYIIGNYNQLNIANESNETDENSIFSSLIKEAWQKFYSPEPAIKVSFNKNNTPNHKTNPPNIFYLAMTKFAKIEKMNFACKINGFSEFKEFLETYLKAWRAEIFADEISEEVLAKQCFSLQQSYNKISENEEEQKNFFGQNKQLINSLLISKLKTIAQTIKSKFKALRTENTIISFNDILDNLSKLANNSVVCNNFANKHKLLIIDEAQDCNELQFDILFSLFSRPSQTCVIVGDAKQSIFAFQGADVMDYLTVVNNSHKKYKLSTNYRSSPAIISALNAIYYSAQEYRKERGAFFIEALKYNEILAPKSNQAIAKINSAAIHLHTFEILSGAEKTKTSELSTQKSCHLAILKAAENSADENKDISVAILVPNNGHIKKISSILQQYNTPHEVIDKSEKKNALQSPATNIVSALLKSILELNTGDENAIRTLLASQFFCVSRKKLLSNFLFYLENVIKPQLRNLEKIFHTAGIEHCLYAALKWKLPKDFYNLPTKKSSTAKINKKKNDTAAEILLKNENGDAILATYLLIAKLLGKLERQEKLQNKTITSQQLLQTLLIKLQEWQNKNIAVAMDENIQTQIQSQRQKKSIVVMNYHSAKGLEFDHVVIPFFGQGFKKNGILEIPKKWLLGNNLDVNISLKKNSSSKKNLEKYNNKNIVIIKKDTKEILGDIPTKLTLEQIAENARKLYVAITRAKKSVSIFMFGNSSNKISKPLFNNCPQFALFTPQIEDNLNKASFIPHLKKNIENWKENIKTITANNLIQHSHYNLEELEKESTSWKKEIKASLQNHPPNAVQETKYAMALPTTVPTLPPINSSGYLESFSSIKRISKHSFFAETNEEVTLGEERKDHDDNELLAEEETSENFNAKAEALLVKAEKPVSSENTFPTNKQTNSQEPLPAFTTNTPSHLLKTRQEFLEKYPFSQLPYGKRRGTLLHNLLQNYQLNTIPTENEFAPKLIQIASDLLKNSGLSPKFANSVANLVQRAVHMPINVAGSNTTFTIASLPNEALLKEETFFFHTNTPLEVMHNACHNFLQHGKKVSSPLKKNKAILNVSFAQETILLKKSGHINGEIDLIFFHDNRYYILDWKSNALNGITKENQSTLLQEEIKKGSYALQYYLYLLALHKFLHQRLKNYCYENHFGGIIYFFLAALAENPSSSPHPNCGIFYDKPSLKQLQQFEYIFNETK